MSPRDWSPRLAAIYIAAAALVVGSPMLRAQPPDAGGTSKSEYLVKPGDQLMISVWKEVDLQHEVLIRPDGGFSFPLAGDIDASGKTVEEIRLELSARLSRYIPDLVATVMVTNINGNKVYVIGQVNSPGEFVMDRELDVMQALSVAGGATAFAQLNDIKILRRGNNGQTVLDFSFNDVARGRDLNQNILLESGDVVVVP